MTQALAPQNALPPATIEDLGKIDAFTEKLRQAPQVHLQTEHILHAGMYARTLRLPAGVVITGCKYKVPTVLVVHGKARVYAGGEWHHVEGYQCFPALAGRKQVFLAIEDTEITMTCRSLAKTVEEAERHMTDEFEQLMSRADGSDDLVIITGVEPCPEQ